jgi:tetratricopeptide (TPR) repeat protein
MRLALYTLLFLGSALLVLDLKKKVDAIDPAPKPDPTQPIPPKKKTQSSTQPQEHPDIRQALEQYSKIIDAAPDKADGYIDRANAYIANRQFADALTDLNKALELNPGNAGYLLQRGAHYLRLGQSEKAVNDFTHALKIDPAFTKALVYRGITHFQSEHFNLALNDFLLLLKKDPQFVDLHLSIAQCYHGLNQQAKANEHLKLYRQLSKDGHAKEKADALEKEWSQRP